MMVCVGKKWDTCHTTTISGITDFSIQHAISGLFPLFKLSLPNSSGWHHSRYTHPDRWIDVWAEPQGKMSDSSSWYTVEIEVAITQNWFAFLLSGLILRDRFRSLDFQKSGTWNRSRISGTWHWREARAAWRRHWVWPSKCWMDYIFHLDW